MKLRLEYLPKGIKAYKEAVRKDIVDVRDKATVMLDDTDTNKAVDDLFRQV